MKSYFNYLLNGNNTYALTKALTNGGFGNIIDPDRVIRIATRTTCPDKDERRPLYATFGKRNKYD
jgi:regulator of extracellular matrix RemA (YlzA/DUF370 family)